VVNVGDDIEVKVLRVDSEERKIGLSRKRVEWAEEDFAAAEAAEAAEAAAKNDPGELKGGIGSDSGPLFKSASETNGATEEDAVEVAQE
jgi:small subunit ribosomal protein S1